MVGRLSRRSGSSRETLSEVCNWLDDPHGGTELVGKLSRRSGSGWKTLLEVW